MINRLLDLLATVIIWTVGIAFVVSVIAVSIGAAVETYSMYQVEPMDLIPAAIVAAATPTLAAFVWTVVWKENH